MRYVYVVKSEYAGEQGSAGGRFEIEHSRWQSPEAAFQAIEAMKARGELDYRWPRVEVEEESDG